MAGAQAAAAAAAAAADAIVAQGNTVSGPVGGLPRADDVDTRGDPLNTQIMRPTPVTDYKGGATTTSGDVSAYALMPAPDGLDPIQAALFKQAARQRRQAAMDEYIDVRAAPVEDFEERFQPPFTGYIPQFNVAAY